MNLESLGNVGEIVGGLGVILSLLYLARQIRENSRVVQAASSQSIADGISAWLNETIGDADVAEIFLRGLRSPENLDPVERYRFNALLASAFGQYQNGFLMVRTRTIDMELWAATEKTIRFYARQPGVQQWLDSSASVGMVESFRVYLTRVVENPDVG